MTKAELKRLCTNVHALMQNLIRKLDRDPDIRALRAYIDSVDELNTDFLIQLEWLLRFLKDIEEDLQEASVHARELSKNR